MNAALMQEPLCDFNMTHDSFCVYTAKINRDKRDLDLLQM